MHRLQKRLLLSAAVLVLAGCPAPPDNQMWKRSGADQETINTEMANCGYPQNIGAHIISRNDEILRFQCMQGKGFAFGSEGNLCQWMEDYPACVAKKQGHPVSLAQLGGLPFNEDRGFHPAPANSGLTEYDFVTWRKKGASQDFSHIIENKRLALPVMYQCGYPQPLGSREQSPTISAAAKTQQCMQEHGFEPISKDKMLVCWNYPQLPACQPSFRPV